MRNLSKSSLALIDTGGVEGSSLGPFQYKFASILGESHCLMELAELAERVQGVEVRGLEMQSLELSS